MTLVPRLSALLALVAAVGCQTISSRPDAGPKAAEDPGGAKLSAAAKPKEDTVEVKVDPALMKTDFKREPTLDQRVNIHYDLARALETQGQFEPALGEYQKVVEAFPSTTKLRGDAPSRAKLHRRVAAALDRLGKFDEARDHYRSAKRLAPKDPDVWNDSGYSHYLQGRWDDAESDLKKAVSLDPANPRILTNLGLTLAASGRVEPAVETLTKAGGPASAHANVAYVLAANGKFEDALKHYRSALAIQPDMPAVRDALARVERRISGPGTASLAAKGDTGPVATTPATR
jgi:Flp pilus assembly protein TadD